MAEKNHIFMGRDGKRIDIQITATSEAMAEKLFQAVELALIEGIRIDLEDQWRRDGGSDRNE